MVAIETPAVRARKIRKLSEEFERVKSARIKRKRLKFPSNPRKESLGTSTIGVKTRSFLKRDSRMKKIATRTAKNAGKEASRNILVNSLRMGVLRFATNKNTSR